LARLTGPIVLDLRDVGRNRRGVGRVLTELGSRLLAWYPEHYHAICGPDGPPLLGDIDADRITIVGHQSQAVYEQFTLPFMASRVRARAIYSHQECGALWGPPLLLHVPEDPEIRWSKSSARATTQLVDPSSSPARERSRRIYSRLLMNRSLRRAHVVTSTRSTAADLAQFHRIRTDQVTVVNLGVDLDKFRPVDNGGQDPAPYLFHLSSNDPREHPDVVIQAFARFAAQVPDAVRLIIAGDLGPNGRSLEQLAAELGVSNKVAFLGWIPDEQLVRLYTGATATVMAAADEGFGLQPLEAMACGSIVVAVPTAATEEIAVGAEVEWTALEAGPMATAFAAVWTDRARQARAVAVNREIASNFSWDRMAKRLHELLCEVGS